MKLNCPICGELIDETHFGTDLGMHLYWQHKPKDEKDVGDVYRYYAVLVFKIHEEIETFSKIENYGELKDKTLAYHIIQELKSLLEDTK